MNNKPCTAEEIHIAMGTITKFGRGMQIMRALEETSKVIPQRPSISKEDYSDLVPVAQKLHPHLDYSDIRPGIIQNIFRRGLTLMRKFHIKDASDVPTLVIAMQNAMAKGGKKGEKMQEIFLSLAPYYEATKK